MYTYSVFVLCDGNAANVQKTVDSLRYASKTIKLDITYIFRKIYEMPPGFQRIINDLQLESTCLLGESITNINEYLIKRPCQIFLLLKEGDILDLKYLRYCDRFFKMNHEACYVAYLQLADSAPDKGAKQVTAVWGEAAKRAGLNNITKVNAAFEDLVNRLIDNKNRIEFIRKAFPVSCIIPIYNGGTCLQESIESILSQNLIFNDNIELILINCGFNEIDDIRSACEDLYPENVICVESDSGNAIKTGLEMACGEFLAFLKEGDRFDENFLQAGVDFLQTHKEVDFVAFPIEIKSDDIHPLDYRFITTDIIDTGKDNNFIQFGVTGTVIRYSSVYDENFSSKLSCFNEAEFIHRLIMKKPLYGVSMHSKLFCNNSDKINSVLGYENIKEFSEAIINNSIQTHGEVTPYTQNCLLYGLYSCSIDQSFEEIESNVNLSEIKNIFKAIIYNINNDIIKSTSYFTLHQRYILLKLKLGKPGFYIEDGQPGLQFGEVFEPIDLQANVSLINEYKSNISIIGDYLIPDETRYTLKAYYNGSFFSAEVKIIDEKEYFLGEVLPRRSSFDISIPFSTNGNIEFFMEVEGVAIVRVNLCYSEVSRLRSIQGSLVFGDRTIITWIDNNKLSVSNLSQNILIQKLIEYVSINLSSNSYAEERNLLQKFANMYPVMSKRHIWLFMDKPENVSYGVEFFFNYCTSLNDGIDKYFIIDKNSPDVQRLNKYGDTVHYGSEEHKLLLLYAEKLIYTTSEYNIIYPFGAASELIKGFVKGQLSLLDENVTADSCISLYEEINL